jgi:sensor c-di-GMP phosphodiesterase-like protein
MTDPLLKVPTADRPLCRVMAPASAMRVKVIAEGVETREQALFLHAAGVDTALGGLWSRAVPPDRLVQLAGSRQVGVQREGVSRRRGHVGH